MDEAPSLSKLHTSLAWPALLFFGSGFAGLTYEVLWQRELGLLFGNTAQATATTLAVFFLGLAAGSWWIGRLASRLRNPLRGFAWLEIGTALTALLLPLLLPLYRSLFGSLYASLGGSPAAFLTVKFLLATLLLGPPAFLMGGTLPALAELAARRGRGLALGGTLLYGLNTAGAVLGAFAAGFLLPPALGYRGAYAIAVGLSLLIGLVALFRARGQGPARAAVDKIEARAAPTEPGLLLLAGLSGFVALGLEVLWTDLYALVFLNSVYTFAAVLVVFLAALALGAGVAHLVSRRTVQVESALRVALLVSGLAVIGSTSLMLWQAGPQGSAGADAGWLGYIAETFAQLAGGLLIPALCLGFLFPFLLRVEEVRRGRCEQAGGRLGRLLAANTIGALLGALLAGFLLRPWFGLWPSISLLGGLLILAGLLLTKGLEDRGRLCWRLGVLCLLGLLVPVSGTITKAGRAWMTKRGEEVLAVYEGAGGTVAVVDRGGDLKLKFNNSYTVGGTADPRWEHYQAHIPLCLHADPKRVFFLGMGSGITAGAALHHDVDLVRVAEIGPQVVRAAREHFTPWVNGLFEDPRVEILVEDGRTVLQGSAQHYDVIVGDLFLPWKRGTALLYTVEQFRAVRERLSPGGLFAQWLALYQLSEAEFLGIARGFEAVFPGATLWRGDFFEDQPIVALVGRVSDTPLEGAAMVAAWRRLEARGAVQIGPAVEALPFLLYAGRLDAAGRRLEAEPFNTDDRPWLEFRAPISERARAAGREQAFVGKRLARFQRTLLARRPAATDPSLREWTLGQRNYVEGGMSFYELGAFAAVEDSEARRQALVRFRRAVPRALRPPMERWIR